MNIKKVLLILLQVSLWVVVFIFTMNYIGKQWEYEGVISRGLLTGVSLRSTEHIFYSIATVLASALTASAVCMALFTLFRRKRTKLQFKLAVISILMLVLIASAFAWNRYQIYQNSLPVSYRYYDSNGKILEQDKFTRTLKDVNILLISVDTLNPKHLSCYGYDRETSPVVDSLAGEGLLFKHAYSQTPKTSPSHMTMFTSLYPSVHKVRNWNQYSGGYSLDHRVITLPEILRHAGYNTAAFTSGGNVQGSIGFDSGFNSYDNHDHFWENASKWLDQNHDSKFFLFLHTFEVHSPYLSPEPYSRMFDKDYHGKILDSEEQLDAYFKEHRQSESEEFPGYHELFWGLVDKSNKREVDHVVALYDGGIRFMDQQMLRKIFKKLNDYHLTDNTLIIFTSDHGEEFLEHGDFLHRELYDEHIHVPLVMKFPPADAVPHSVIDQQVRTIDLMPTILDYIDLPIPVMAQGTSLIPVVHGKQINLPAFSERIVISDVPDLKKSMRTPEWKYIWWPNEKKQELYDLVLDPGELHNVAEQHQKEAANLHRQVTSWMEVNKTQGSSIKAFTHNLDKETIEKLKSLGYMK